MMRLFDCVRRWCPKEEKKEDIIDPSVTLESAVKALRECITNIEITLESLGFISSIPRVEEERYTTKERNKISKKYDRQRRDLAFQSNILLQGATPYNSTLINNKEHQQLEQFAKSTRYIHSGRLPDKTLVAKKEHYHSAEELKEITQNITNLFVVKTQITRLIQQAEKREFLPHHVLAYADEYINTLKENESCAECVSAWKTILSHLNVMNHEAGDRKGFQRRFV